MGCDAKSTSERQMWHTAGPREAFGGTGKRSALPEIAEDDVYHGSAPVGAAAAHRGLAKCVATVLLIT